MFIAVTLFLPQGIVGLLRGPNGIVARLRRSARKEEGSAS
jgi:urea transport system permease protein